MVEETLWSDKIKYAKISMCLHIPSENFHTFLFVKIYFFFKGIEKYALNKSVYNPPPPPAVFFSSYFLENSAKLSKCLRKLYTPSPPQKL